MEINDIFAMALYFYFNLFKIIFWVSLEKKILDYTLGHLYVIFRFYCK